MRTMPALLVLLLAVVAAACSGSPGSSAGASSGVSTSPGATVPSDPRVTSAEDAIAAIRGSSPLFDGIEANDPDLIGQGSWYEVVPAADGTPGAWDVTIEVGWGDCPAGCIDRHTWRWTVAADGTVTLGSETGSPLTDDVLAGLLAAATGTGLGGRVLAGPVCPVEQPGDPACAPRAVSGATLVVKGDNGSEVAGLTTDGSGFYRFGGLTPGTYTLEAGAVEGLMGTPAPMPVTVIDGTLTLQDVVYDTGIR